MYGSTFVSGWSGYFLSGKVAPAGRIIVMDNERVYSFGRKPEYFRWTTPIEYQLFAADKKLAVVESAPRRGPSETSVQVAKAAPLATTGTPFTVSAWIQPDKPDGVVVARGGGVQGFSLYLKGGRPTFSVRSAKGLVSVSAKKLSLAKWVHLTGMLSDEHQLSLHIDGRLAAAGPQVDPMSIDPAEGLEIGADEGTSVGDYKGRFPFNGTIDEVAVFRRALSDTELQALVQNTDGPLPADCILAYSFDNGKASDRSENHLNRRIVGAEPAAGKFGKGLRFVGDAKRIAGYRVHRFWTQDLPFLARALVLSDDPLFVAGPPDLIDEARTLRRISETSTQEKLQEQLASIEGKKGGLLSAVSTSDGRTLATIKLDTPPVFDGMAAADRCLFLSTVDGHVQCFGARINQ